MVSLQIKGRERKGTFVELMQILQKSRAKEVSLTKEGRYNDITLEMRENLQLYISDIEKNTKRKITSKQLYLITDYVDHNRILRADKKLEKKLKGEYQRKKKSLIERWEKETGQEWPTYSQDINDKKGRLIRLKGQFYDAHHIIELSYSGVNEWWNIFPARHPDEHQQGIHHKNSIASQLFIDGKDSKNR